MNAHEILDTIEASVKNLHADATPQDLPMNPMLEDLLRALVEVLTQSGLYGGEIRGYVDGLQGACTAIYRGTPQGNIPYHKDVIQRHVELIQNLLPQF